jgi:hypothetical protein
MLSFAWLGCADPPIVSGQPLSWQFVDGRDCENAGVAAVDVLEGSAVRLGRFACLDGLMPSWVTLPDFAGALEVIGRSPQEAPLYTGRIAPELPVRPAVVTLFAEAAN